MTTFDKVVFVVVALGLCALLLVSCEAEAQQPCAARSVLVERLGSTYHEQRLWRGLRSTQEELVELWASNDGSWTVIRSNAHGISCVMAAGKGWEVFVPEDVAPGEPG